MSETKEVKIGMFGGGGVGKTCITLRFLKGEFTEGYIPTIEDQFSKVVEVDGKPISLSIVDTAGQDDFKEMRYSYYRQVTGFVLVFDIGNPQSIDDLREMYADIQDAVDGEVQCIVAANKADLRDENGSDLVPKEEYDKIKKEFKCEVLETSAKTGTNIEDLYIHLIKLIIGGGSSKAPSQKTEKKEPKKQEDSGGCCNIA